MADIGWAVIGSGRRAQEVIPAIQKSTSCKVVGVHAREPGHLGSAIADWPKIKTYQDLDAMLEEPEVQVAYIASPHFLHVPQAASALEYKKHVLMESPLALSVDGAHKLVEKARSEGLLLGVAFQHRFHPALIKLKEKIEQGELGKIKHLAVWCARPVSLADSWWTDVNRSGPAALFRMGVFAIDLCSWLKNEPVDEVMAMGTFEGEESLNTSVSILLRYRDEESAYAFGSCAFTRPDHGIKVEGTRARLSVQGDFKKGGDLVMKEVTDSGQEEFSFERQDPVNNMVSSFCKAVEQGTDYKPTGADARKTVEITCAVIESMKRRSAVKVGDVLRDT